MQVLTTKDNVTSALYNHQRIRKYIQRAVVEKCYCLSNLYPVFHKTYESMLMQSLSQLSVVHFDSVVHWLAHVFIHQKKCPNGPVASTRGQQMNLFQSESECSCGASGCS